MEKMELYKKIAIEIEEKLGPNHISTILRLDDFESPDQLIRDLPLFLIIVKKFDKYTLMMVTNILREYPEELEIPFVVEYNDVQGMLDSIPKSFLEIKMNYSVLSGTDVTEMIKPPSYEHFRAQTELELRNDILNLRRGLIRVMSHQMNPQEYLKEVSIVTLNSIRNYYKIVKPDLNTTDQLIEEFNRDFPMGKESLQKILEYTYQTIKGIDITVEDQLQLILSSFDNILQPLLIETDALGLEFEKNLGKDSERLSYEEFIEKYRPEIDRLQDAIYEEFEQDRVKREHVLRGELELKFRDREKKIVEKYEAELQELKSSFDEKLKERTEEFLNKKIQEEQNKIEKEYEDKIKKIKDELEFKYITTDLNDKEAKLRKEFNEYEKKLRDSYLARERDLKQELELNKKNFRESLEIEYRAKLEEEKEKLRKDFEEDLEDRLSRGLNNQQRRLETEMKRRETTLEKTLKNEFKRKENEIIRQFKKELQLKEKEVKTKLQLDFERQKGKIESKKSEDLLKLMEKEMALRYKEIEKIQLDLMKVVQTKEIVDDFKRAIPKPEITRNFIIPPKSDENRDEKDLFSKILRDNRSLSSGLPKKGVKTKKVS